jgi:hypothetical protein
MEGGGPETVFGSVCLDAHTVVGPNSVGDSESPGQPEGCPVVRRADRQPAKVLRHHADDLVRQPIDAHATADHALIAGEQLVPAPVTQHDHRLGGTQVIVFWQQGAPKHRRDAERLEEVPGDERGVHGTPLEPGPDGATHRDEIGEDAPLSAHRLVLAPRESQRWV